MTELEAKIQACLVPLDGPQLRSAGTPEAKRLKIGDKSDEPTKKQFVIGAGECFAAVQARLSKRLDMSALTEEDFKSLIFFVAVVRVYTTDNLAYLCERVTTDKSKPDLLWLSATETSEKYPVEFKRGGISKQQLRSAIKQTENYVKQTNKHRGLLIVGFEKFIGIEASVTGEMQKMQLVRSDIPLFDQLFQIMTWVCDPNLLSEQWKKTNFTDEEEGEQGDEEEPRK